jgi:hypothetical protein
MPAAAGHDHARLARFQSEGLSMKKLFLTVLTIAISTSAMAQQAFSSLEEQMKGKEFEAAGLDKLTAEELAALNNWIRSHSLATLEEGRAVSGTGGNTRGVEIKSIKDMPRTTINSRLVGDFTGWDGQTTFRLENGMVWQQADKDKFYVKAISNPVVTIEPRALKTWRLSVEGYDSKCKVKRLE